MRMPRRCNDTAPDDVPRKKNCIAPTTTSSFDLKHGEFLTDISGKQWRLGKAVGVGGFGEIYLASDNLNKEVKTDSKYVAKVESHTNGPLFVEINCYLRVAKSVMIEEWKKQTKNDSLGMPHYVASGSHIHKGERYRFLIIPRFETDLEQILQEKKCFNIKTVLTISSQIMEVIEYIHSKGYIHSDIKASNILLSNQKSPKKTTIPPRLNKLTNCYPIRACRRIQKPTRCTRNLRPHSNVNYVDDIPNFDEILEFWHSEEKTDVNDEPLCRKDQVYLLDYGLACKYLTSDGNHKQVCIDERKAHAGTILFCSRDAHKGITSRRSDLESLGYNIIYWLTGNLPWKNDVEDPEIVAKKKQKAMANIEYFLGSCFLDYPKFLLDYFRYLQNLNCQENPDYSYCKRLFKQSIISNGYEDDSVLDFDNTQVCQLKPNKLKKKSENVKVPKFTYEISRPPLQSNIPIKPLLRKKVKNTKLKPKVNLFEVPDPEVILKQAREKKNSENESNFNNIAYLNIERLNPTAAMIEIYNKCKERIDASPSHKGDSCPENVDGYTHAMLAVLQKSRQRKEYEMNNLVVNLCNINCGTTVKRCINKRKKKNESPIRSPPKTRTTKSSQVIKRDHFQAKKSKAVPLRRTYSLRG